MGARVVLATALAASAVVALPSTAAAKGRVESVRVCGPRACVTVASDRRAALLLLVRPAGVASTPRPSPFYRVEVASEARGEAREAFFYVPAAAALRPAAGPGLAGPSLRQWLAVTPEAAARYRALVRGLAPFPAPRLAAVRVGGRTVVEGAGTYLRLFDLPSAGAGSRRLAFPLPIDLRAERPSPWTGGPEDLSFSARTGYLARGGEVVRVPEGLLDDLRAGRALAPGVKRGGPPGWAIQAAA
ncbi:MAG TPA: hypothetical protein VNJ46_00935, partial [Gaiellaceae bacterium]|nr:hypothetical protein [Gaiellaceae bacterium]